MAGAWERKESVFVYSLHTDLVSIAWAYGLRNLIIPNGQIAGITGMPYDHARNAACQMALNGGFDWILSIDSDVIPPHDALVRLLARRKPVISGLYCRRSPPHGVPVAMKPVGQWVTRFPRDAVIDVDVVGAGCLLIHRSVLEQIPPQRPGHPWFDWRVNMQGFMPPGECLSEDFTLCMHIKRALGIPILLDTSVQCRHVGLAQSTYGSFVPCEATPVT